MEICFDADQNNPVLFTVANLIITQTFAKDRQALAGSVFEVTAQLGTSVGLAVMAVISQSVTNKTPDSDKSSAHSLMPGFRAAFWTMFGILVTAALVGVAGLRQGRRLGV